MGFFIPWQMQSKVESGSMVKQPGHSTDTHTIQSCGHR